MRRVIVGGIRLGLVISVLMLVVSCFSLKGLLGGMTGNSKTLDKYSAKTAMRECNAFQTTYEDDLNNKTLQNTAGNIQTLLTRERKEAEARAKAAKEKKSSPGSEKKVTKKRRLNSWSQGSNSGNWADAPKVTKLMERIEAAKALKAKFGPICSGEDFTSITSPGCSGKLRHLLERELRPNYTGMKYKQKQAAEADFRTKKQELMDLETYSGHTTDRRNPTHLCEAAAADVVALYQKEVRALAKADLEDETMYFASVKHCTSSSNVRLNDLLPTADIAKWKTKYEKLYASVGLDVSEFDAHAESIPAARAAGMKRLMGLATAQKALSKEGKNPAILKIGKKRLNKFKAYKKAKVLRMYSASEAWRVNKNSYGMPINRVWFGQAIMKLRSEKKWCVAVEFYGDQKYIGGGRYGRTVGKSGNRHCFIKCP